MSSELTDCVSCYRKLLQGFPFTALFSTLKYRFGFVKHILTVCVNILRKFQMYNLSMSSQDPQRFTIKLYINATGVPYINSKC
jgi:hypothetical protein